MMIASTGMPSSSAPKLLYSWNEGSKWNEIESKSTSAVTEITSIVTDGDAVTQDFVVVGHTAERKLVAVHLDFSSLHQRACKGEADAGEI